MPYVRWKRTTAGRLARYAKPVVRLTVLGEPSLGNHGEFGYARWVCRMGLRFPLVSLAVYRTRRTDLKSSANPLAVVTLAHLSALETAGSPAVRYLGGRRHAPERLAEILDPQIERQSAALSEELAAREIDPAWDLASVYRALGAERMDAARRRSAEWLSPRRALAEKIPTLALDGCARIESELNVVPGYLSSEDREVVEQLVEMLAQRIAALEGDARRARIQTWRRGLPAIDEIGTLDKHRTEAFLKDVQNPPETLLPEERAELAPLAEALNAHYDQTSMDEIMARIERLSAERRQALFEWLAKRVASG